MSKNVLLFVVAGLLSANIALANEEEVKSVNEEMAKKYIALKVGRFNPNADYGATNDRLNNFDSDMNYEVAFGSRKSKHFAFDFGFGYYSASGKNVPVNKTSFYDATVTAIGILPISSVDLFAGIGAGVYFAKLKAPCFEGNYLAIGYQFLGGVDINITKNIAIGGEVKYSQAKPEYTMIQSGSIELINIVGTTYNGAVKFRY